MSIVSEDRIAGPFSSGTVLPFTFNPLEAANVRVVKTLADGTILPDLASPADYTVAVNVNQDVSPGGAVTLTTAISGGDSVVVTSDVPYTQPTTVTNLGNFLPATLNKAFDRLCVQIQQVKSITDRCLRLPVSSLLTDFTVEPPTGGSVLAYNNDGTGVVNGPTVVDIAAASAASTTAVAAAGASQVSAIQAAGHASDAQASVDEIQAIADALIFPLQFNTSTSAANPSSGKFAINNATPASATALYISATTTGGSDISNWIKSWDDGTSVIRGIVTFKSTSTPSTYLKLNLTGAVFDNTTWLSIPVTFNSSSGSLANDENVSVSFAANGDLGSVSIGGAIGGAATVGSVLFVGTGTVIQQDNANLFWNDTTNALGIGTATPNTNAILHLASTTRGFQMPAMTKAQLDAISMVSGDDGLMVYSTDLKTPFVFKSGGAGWTAICTAYRIAAFFDPARLEFGSIGGAAFKGYLNAPGTALAADINWNLPARSGDILARATSTIQATTSGTSKTFSSIPAGVKKITIMFADVSLSGTANLLVRVRVSGASVSSGYTSTSSGVAAGVASIANTTGFCVYSPVAGGTATGRMELELMDAATFRWSQSHSGANAPLTSSFFGGGGIVLAGNIDGIEVTTTNGTDTFDNGNINISWE